MRRSTRICGLGTPTWTMVPAWSRAWKACFMTSGWPTASTVTSAPKPPVSSRTAVTGLTWLESTRSVAPSSPARASLRRSMSTAMTLRAPTRAAGGGVAFPDHGHGSPPPPLGRCHDGPEPGHDPAADQAGRLGPGGRVDLDRLAVGDQADLGEGAEADGGGKRGAVLQGHLLAGVAAGKAVPGAAAPAGAALAARRPPGQNDEVAGGEVGHAGPDRLDLPGRLVAEQERELVVDRALAVVQVGVADPAGLHPDQRLPRPGVWHQHRGQLDRRPPLPGDHAPHPVSHCPLPPRVSSRGGTLPFPSGQEGVRPQLGLDLGIEAVAGVDPELVAEADHHGGAGAADLEVDRGLAAVGAEDMLDPGDDAVVAGPGLQVEHHRGRAG